MLRGLKALHNECWCCYFFGVDADSAFVWHVWVRSGVLFRLIGCVVSLSMTTTPHHSGQIPVGNIWYFAAGSGESGSGESRSCNGRNCHGVTDLRLWIRCDCILLISGSARAPLAMITSCTADGEWVYCKGEWGSFVLERTEK